MTAMTADDTKTIMLFRLKAILDGEKIPLPIDRYHRGHRKLSPAVRFQANVAADAVAALVDMIDAEARADRSEGPIVEEVAS